MADHEPTTLTLLPVTPRGLVIPHILTADELAALLRIGEALESIAVRLAAVMGRPGGPLASEVADLATLTIDLLDVVEGDPEAEEGGDAEPSLGWTVHGVTASGTLDASPFLSDLEEEHNGREPDDDAEPWRVPARLDVLPRGVFIGRRP